MSENRDGGWVQDLLKAWLFRGATDESTISEHIQWNLQTKGCLPVVQAVGVSAGLSFLILGMWFLLGFYYDVQQKGYSWSWIPAAIGVVLLIPGFMLAYHQAKALLDPFGKTSALERKMMQYVDLLFGQDLDDDNQPADPGARLLPVRTGGKVTGASTRGKESVSALHPRDERMIQFIREAEVVGLGRRHWLGRVFMGEPMGREAYESIIDDLARWDFIDRGGSGVAARWLVTPKDALQTLAQEIAYLREEEGCGSNEED